MHSNIERAGIMKTKLAVILLTASLFASAQSVTLSKAVKTGNTADKFLYKIDPSTSGAQYLGEIEVEGYTEKEPEIFTLIYKKAKTIGANAFALKPEDSIAGAKPIFNPSHYRLNLYSAKDFPNENNTVYIFSSKKTPSVRIGGKKIVLAPRTYIKEKIEPGTEYSISASGLLGSRIKLSYKEGQPVQYYQVSSFGVRSDQGGQGGISIKSGDITRLERSYADFLTVIYRRE